jgi:hypothetical protein
MRCRRTGTAASPGKAVLQIGAPGVSTPTASPWPALVPPGQLDEAACRNELRTLLADGIPQ